MTTTDLSALIERVALEKDLPESAITGALEAAMAAVCRKGVEPGAHVLARLDPDGQGFAAWRRWDVVADDARLEDPARQLRLMDALDLDPGAEEGGVVVEPVAVPDLSRVVARHLYQHLVEHLRVAGREQDRQAWAGRVGEMVAGTVKRFANGAAVLDVEGTEVAISREQQLPGERLRVGARVRALVVGLNDGPRGAVVEASRKADGLLEQLLAQEVPEVGQGVVRVRAVARDHTGRAKVAVQSLDSRVDPVGACIGMRGCRIQAVSEALGGERVDLVVWSEDPAEMVVRALAPANPVRLVLDAQAGSMDVAVPEGEVGLALGRGGQNVRLASRLTGWRLEVMSEADLDAREQQARQAAVALLGQALDLDEELAGLLVEEGFEDIEAVAWVGLAELLAVDGMDEDLAGELQSRARGVLEGGRDEPTVAEGPDQAWWNGLPAELRQALEAAGVGDRQTLGECAAHELEDVDGLDAATAGALILSARAAWLQALGA